jgi:hypothetical protein
MAADTCRRRQLPNLMLTLSSRDSRATRIIFTSRSLSVRDSKTLGKLSCSAAPTLGPPGLSNDRRERAIPLTVIDSPHLEQALCITSDPGVDAPDRYLCIDCLLTPISRAAAATVSFRRAIASRNARIISSLRPEAGRRLINSPHSFCNE